jgi:predicted phage-related endonuclease
MLWRTAIDCETERGWLARRRIGSSDIAKILGRSSFGTSWDVWRRLHGLATPRPATEAQTRGHAWERTCLVQYGESQPQITEVRAPGRWDLHQGPEPWATASPDGYAYDHELATWGLVEAKTDRNADHWGEPGIVARWDDEAAARVRSDYALQVYWQLWVVGAPWCDLAVLLPFYDLRVYRLVRDREVEAALVDTVGAWVQRHVVEGHEPLLDGSDAASSHLADRFFRSSASALRPASVAEAAIAYEYERAKVARDVAEQQRRHAAQMLVLAIGEGKGLTIGDEGRVISVRRKGSARLDVKRLRKERPDLESILDEYTTTGDPSVSIRTYNLNNRSNNDDQP